MSIAGLAWVFLLPNAVYTSRQLASYAPPLRHNSYRHNTLATMPSQQCLLHNVLATIRHLPHSSRVSFLIPARWGSALALGALLGRTKVVTRWGSEQPTATARGHLDSKHRRCSKCGVLPQPYNPSPPYRQKPR